MQYVTIWDLDYYHAKEKKNVFNPDAMKISSYHKQMGDKVNFVTTKADIRRPYDVYYIIKEKSGTANPPFDFFTNSRVKWWGKAFAARINWKMPDGMIICRPDYLLYPEHDTSYERAEQIRLFNDKGELLPRIQDWTNTFTNKHVIITDKNFWFASKNDIVAALEMLQGIKRVSFFEPIWIQKLLSDETIKNLFVTLDLAPGANIHWTPIPIDNFEAAFNLIKEVKNAHPYTFPGTILVDYKTRGRSHWESKEYALEDFNNLKKIVVWAKREKVKINIMMPKTRYDTPYFLIFEELSNWTMSSFDISWLEYLTKRFGEGSSIFDEAIYWAHPEKWNEVFRDLLRQTYEDEEFLLIRWGEKMVSFNDIPWSLWRKEFKNGL